MCGDALSVVYDVVKRCERVLAGQKVSEEKTALQTHCRDGHVCSYVFLCIACHNIHGGMVWCTIHGGMNRAENILTHAAYAT